MTAIAATGCDRAESRPPEPPPAASTHALEQVVRWTGTLELEESREVLNVAPMVTVLGDGGFLVADMREAQVRVYGRDGKLRERFGRRGRGPGELEAPISAVELPSGDVAVAEVSGLVSVFEKSERRPLASFRAPALPLYGAQPFGDGRLLVAGRGTAGGTRRDLLHLWEPGTERVRSFFPSPVADDEQGGAGAYGGFAMAARRGGEIAAAFSFTDTVFVFDAQGRRLRSLPIPFADFRLPRTDRRARTIPEARALLDAATPIRDLWWLADGRFLVQTSRFREGEERFGLLAMDAGGRRLFELADSPRLLAVDAAGTLVFVTPGSPTPNRWSLARLSR